MRTFQKKVCLLGDFAVGKTSLVRRYVERRFDDKYLTTVGVVVTRKQLRYPDYLVNLLIWDLAGGRDFFHSGYLAGVSGALLVCDLTRTTTLATYQQYANQLRVVNPEVVLILLANKADLVAERSISDEELWAVSNELDAPVIITSAKTGDDVDQAFSILAENLVTKEA